MVGKLFSYTNVDLNSERTVATFNYTIDTDRQSFDLSETIEFPLSLPTNPVVASLLRALHIALGISYYKTFIPPAISHPYAMEADEASFWNSVFENGMGEFLYKNRLDPSKIAQFSEQDGISLDSASENIDWTDSALLGVGGGKDSIVAGEILKELSIPTTGFVLATASNRGQTHEVVQKMGIDLLAIQRRLDPKILELNTYEGAYNGHIPISLIFALTGCLLAAARSSRYVVVANESSSSIPNVQWSGLSINHQWSKSLEFERMFQQYINKYVSKDLHYTSIIRPLSSLAVAKIFAQYPEYFEVFTSDNSLFKIKQEARSHPRWSNNSPKSLSSYILLAPWMSDEQLNKTFGSNFLNKPELEALFLALTGAEGEPVLDCVGTPDELLLSLSLLDAQARMQNTYLMQIAKGRDMLLKEPGKDMHTALLLSPEHALPSELTQKIIGKLTEKLA